MTQKRAPGKIHPSSSSKPSDWLLAHRRSVTSQLGEDGIIEEIFSLLPPQEKRWCVEFGAGDGHYLSNTYNLIVNHGWYSIQIEANLGRFLALTRLHSGNERVICLNQLITFEGSNSLDSVLSRAPIPKDFDLLSIDIDGNDYYIWESLQEYRPKVLIIEFNPTIPHYVSFVQSCNMSVNQGCSLLALVELGKRKGYELICSTEWNGIFVDKEYFSLFGISDNSIWKMNQNYHFWTYVFQGYDGRIFVGGMNRLLWHGISVDLEAIQESIQILPPEQRVYRDRPG